MFARRAAAAKITDAMRVSAVDAAFDVAVANARALGTDVAGRILTEHRVGRIDRQGIDRHVEHAVELTAGQADGVPRMMLEQILDLLRSTIETELAAAGIPVRKNHD
jgi:hypothetical protein